MLGREEQRELICRLFKLLELMHELLLVRQQFVNQLLERVFCLEDGLLLLPELRFLLGGHRQPVADFLEFPKCATLKKAITYST